MALHCRDSYHVVDTNLAVSLIKTDTQFCQVDTRVEVSGCMKSAFLFLYHSNGTLVAVISLMYALAVERKQTALFFCLEYSLEL